MKIAIIAAVLGAVALFSVSGSISAQAADVNDYRWQHSQGLYPWSPSWSQGFNCRVVEIHTTNRWGNDLLIRRRICD